MFGGGEKNASRKYGENVFDRRDGAKRPQVSKTPDGEFSREEDGEAGPFSSRWEATTAARRYGCGTEGQSKAPHPAPLLWAAYTVWTIRHRGL